MELNTFKQYSKLFVHSLTHFQQQTHLSKISFCIINIENDHINSEEIIYDWCKHWFHIDISIKATRNKINNIKTSLDQIQYPIKSDQIHHNIIYIDIYIYINKMEWTMIDISLLYDIDSFVFVWLIVVVIVVMKTETTNLHSIVIIIIII